MKSIAIILPALLAFSLPAAHAATLLSDTFDGSSLNTSTWAFGSNGGLGTSTLGSGNLTLDVNQQANSARAAVLTNSTNFNPFAGALTVNLGGLALGGDPGTSFNSLYSVIGRLPTDTGGVANAGLAASYSSGGAYGTGGAFGVGLLGFSSSYRIQVLDSGSEVAVKQVQIALSNAPTDMTYTIDGAGATWTLSITGATFTGNFLANGLSATQVNANTITGSLINFTEAGITSGEDIVSRFGLGANNGTGVIDGAIATFGDVSITQAAIPEPSTFALLASALVGGLVVTRRQSRTQLA